MVPQKTYLIPTLRNSNQPDDAGTFLHERIGPNSKFSSVSYVEGEGVLCGQQIKLIKMESSNVEVH
jgi:hypothetical protein